MLPKVQAVPGVESAWGSVWGYARTMTLLAVDPKTITAMHAMDDAAAAQTRALTDKGVLVRDTVAARHKWKVGARYR